MEGYFNTKAGNLSLLNHYLRAKQIVWDLVDWLCLCYIQ